ncbi:trypsin-like peptidase domain-containing protein [Tundrisphaera sp. TA3]|uniref:trypsin-like peptidase domain-containing protein n=1 Tax=Tundrisphaera sp. TA3 TaxID=3435775 RepID=UPI003EC1423D
MTSIDPPNPDDAPAGVILPPPRPTTPPIRRGFVRVFLSLLALTILVYGIPYLLERSGYAYESGRARASAEALSRLDKAGVIDRASELFRLAANAVSPAVVNIRTQTFGPKGGGTVGSGVIVDKAKGYIVTNNHVIEGADEIVVRVGRWTEVQGELVGADPRTDLAVIRVKATLPADAGWGESDRLEIGEWVVAIGSPFGLERSVTVGIVSATERNNLGIVGPDQAFYENFIQTDASINPGNSGGPLVDLRGRVIGINTAIIADDRNFKGIGLAIPSDMARKVVGQLIGSGQVVRGFLGVGSQEVSAEQAARAHLEEPRGALVSLVLPGSPAEKAGLRVDDIIVGIDGKAVDDPIALRNHAFLLEVGADVPISYLRDGQARSTKAKIVAMPADRVVSLFGVTVKEVPRDQDGVLAVDQVVPGSPADRAGLKVGDRVLAFGMRPILSKSDFDTGINQFALTGRLQLLVSRSGKREVVSVGIESGPPARGPG